MYKRGDNDEILYIIDKFEPLINKYSKKLGYYCSRTDMIISLINIINNLNNNNNLNEEKYIVGYINISIKHKYIELSKKYTINNNELVVDIDKININKEIYNYNNLDNKFLLENILSKLNNYQRMVIEQIFFKNISEIELSNKWGYSVERLQKLLIGAGYSVGSYGADGVFGEGTYNAVIKYQRDHGLSQDGIVGIATWNALSSCIGDGSTLLRKGSRGEAVRNLQESLISHGYSVGSYGADGAFGEGTYNAVIKFQRDHGLSQDGIVGPATWNAL